MIFNKKPTYEQHDNEKGSFYKSSVEFFNYSETLENEAEVDICVIGGGITGVSSAYYLAKKGYSVSLFEARTIGWGASGRNGGQLGGGLRKEQRIIEEKLGFEHAFELWKLGLEAVDEVKKNIEKYNINCSLTKGVVSAGYYKDDKKYFLNEINHMEKKYNFSKYFFLNKSEINQEINTNQYYCGLLITNSYHLNPLKYLYGLTKEAINQNVQIYEDMPVELKTTSSIPKDIYKGRSSYFEQLGMYCAMANETTGRLYIYKRQGSDQPDDLRVYEATFTNIEQIVSIMQSRRDLFKNAIERNDPSDLPQCKWLYLGCDYSDICKCRDKTPDPPMIAREEVEITEIPSIAIEPFFIQYFKYF